MDNLYQALTNPRNFNNIVDGIASFKLPEKAM